MKVAALVLFVAVAGLLVVGAVDAKAPMKHFEKPKIAAATASADATAYGKKVAVTATCVDTYVDACGCCIVSGSSAWASSVAMS